MGDLCLPVFPDSLDIDFAIFRRHRVSFFPVENSLTAIPDIKKPRPFAPG